MTLNLDVLERPYPRTPEQVRGMSHGSHMTQTSSPSLPHVCRCELNLMQMLRIHCQASPECHCKHLNTHLVHIVLVCQCCMVHAVEVAAPPSSMMPVMEEASVGVLVKIVPRKVCVPHCGWYMQRQQPRSSTSNPKCTNRSSVSCSVWLEWAAKNCKCVHSQRASRWGWGWGWDRAGPARPGELVCAGSPLSLKWGR